MRVHSENERIGSCSSSVVSVERGHSGKLYALLFGVDVALSVGETRSAVANFVGTWPTPRLFAGRPFSGSDSLDCAVCPESVLQDDAVEVLHLVADDSGNDGDSSLETSITGAGCVFATLVE